MLSENSCEWVHEPSSERIPEVIVSLCKPNSRELSVKLYPVNPGALNSNGVSATAISTSRPEIAEPSNDCADTST